MYKIGEFAEICKVPVKTLRYYDEIGILKPQAIDRATGYRYYSVDEIIKYNKIIGLKKIGFSLEEVKEILNGDSGKHIDNKKKELLQKIDDIKQQLIQIQDLEKNMNIPFTNDQSVIGKWEVVGTVTSREQFRIDEMNYQGGILPKDIYFMPNGEKYWILSWTRGYVILENYLLRTLNPYTIEIIDEVTYMFLERTAEDCLYYGEVPMIYVLRKMNDQIYHSSDIRIYDRIDIPFVADSDVLGKWYSIDFVTDIGEFEDRHKKSIEKNLYLKSISFKKNGELERVSEKFKTSSSNVRWTKGFVIDECEYTASAYILREIEEKIYLFLEWKSGDYIYGKRKPMYYVFAKENR